MRHTRHFSVSCTGSWSLKFLFHASTMHSIVPFCLRWNAPWLHVQAAAAHKNVSVLERLSSGCNICHADVWGEKPSSQEKHALPETSKKLTEIEHALQQVSFLCSRESLLCQSSPPSHSHLVLLRQNCLGLLCLSYSYHRLGPKLLRVSKHPSQHAPLYCHLLLSTSHHPDRLGHRITVQHSTFTIHGSPI